MRTKNYIQIKILKNDILPLFDPKDSWSSYVCGHFFFSFLVQALVAVFDSSTRWQQFTCHVEQLPSLHFGLAGTVGGKHCTPLQPQWWRSHLLRSPVELWKRRFGSVCLGVFCIFLISSVKYRGGNSSQQSSARASWSSPRHKCSSWGKHTFHSRSQSPLYLGIVQNGEVFSTQ